MYCTSSLCSIVHRCNSFMMIIFRFGRQKWLYRSPFPLIFFTCTSLIYSIGAGIGSHGDNSTVYATVESVSSANKVQVSPSRLKLCRERSRQNRLFPRGTCRQSASTKVKSGLETVSPSLAVRRVTLRGVLMHVEV